MKDVIIISGPTAVGKTSLAVELAKKLNTEIISSDSMQIYKHMDIGTAKVNKEEMDGVKHHLIDIINPDENYSVQQFQTEAYKIFEKLHENGKIPIVVGGTGLYVDSLTHNFDFLNVKPDKSLRNKLKKIYENNPSDLLDMVLDIDYDHYKHLSISEMKKMIRAIEVYKHSNKLINYDRIDKNSQYNYYLYVLNDDRKVLYDRINRRVDDMLNLGLIDEVKSLLEIGVSKNSQSMKAIGYKEIIMYLDREYTYDEMVEKLKQNSRHYAKRQLTWFRRNEYTKWIDVSKYTEEEIITKILNDIGVKIDE